MGQRQGMCNAGVITPVVALVTRSSVFDIYTGTFMSTPIVDIISRMAY